MNTTEMQDYPLQLCSSGPLGSLHLPPEPPFPCTTLSVRHPVSSEQNAFLRPPSWSWLSQGRTLFFCHIEGMWRSRFQSSVVNHHLCVLLSDSPMYLWGSLEQRLYQTAGRRNDGYTTESGITSRRRQSVYFSRYTGSVAGETHSKSASETPYSVRENQVHTSD